MLEMLAGLLMGAVLITLLGLVIDRWIRYGVQNDLVDLNPHEDEDREDP